MLGQPGTGRTSGAFPERQRFCRQLLHTASQLRNVYQSLRVLENEAGSYYALRRSVQTVSETTARNIQQLSQLAAQECSQCKNL